MKMSQKLADVINRNTPTPRILTASQLEQIANARRLPVGDLRYPDRNGFLVEVGDQGHRSRRTVIATGPFAIYWRFERAYGNLVFYTSSLVAEWVSSNEEAATCMAQLNKAWRGIDGDSFISKLSDNVVPIPRSNGIAMLDPVEQEYCLESELALK